MMRALMTLCVLAACLPATGDGCFVPRPSRRDIYEPTQKALILFQQGREDLILQVKYSGAVDDFAWIVPTPGRPAVGECDPAIFSALSIATNPRPAGKGGHGTLGGGAMGGLGAPSVHVLEMKTVGVYDVAVLAANDPGALLRWLKGHGYAVSGRLTSVIDEYIWRGYYFTAMRIDPRRAAIGGDEKDNAIPRDGLLQPIRLTFRCSSPIYPLKISSLNGGVTDLLLYLMTPMPVNPAGLREEFSAQKSARELRQITRGSPQVHEDLWLTKLSAKMPASGMTQDLVFSYRILPTVTPAGRALYPRQRGSRVPGRR